ncbi:ATP-dependent RNA helicase dhx29 [Rhizophlyctis rosea]|nr:ATP-dependent RNA helicase dhx29 [Rhizophlyctis rosea]
MGPKKKKKAPVPNTRGFATTSIIKPQPKEEQEDVPPSDLIPDDAPSGRALDANSAATIDTSPVVAVLEEAADDWEKSVSALPPLAGVPDVSAMVRTTTLKLHLDFAKDERRRREINRDNSIPILRLGNEVEKYMQEFLTTLDAFKAHDWVSEEASEETSVPRLYTNYMLLERLGFQEADIVQAMKVTGGHRSSTVLTWLCINVPIERLPTAFTDKLDYDRGNTISMKAAERAADSPRPEQKQAASEVAIIDPPVTTKTSNSNASADADIKSWILRSTALDSDSDDSDDLEAQAKQLAVKHGEFYMQMDDVLDKIAQAKASKDNLREKELNSSLQSIRRKLSEIEVDPGFKREEAEKHYLQLQSEREKVIQIESDNQVKPMGDETSDSKEDDGDGDMLLDLFDAPSDPAPTSAPPSSTTTYTIRSITVGNWTGRTPKQLLQDWISKNARGANITYVPIKDSGRGFRAGLRFSGGKGKEKVDGVSVEMGNEERVETKKDAEEFVAMKALYHLAGDLPLHRSLPPAFRDVWLEWVNSVKDEEDRQRRKVEEERIKAVAPLAEARDQLIKEYKESLAATPASSIIQKESSKQEWRRVTSTLKDFGKQWSQRTRSAEYNEILKQRQVLPVYAMRNEILAAISSHQVVIISGETGSGKSTQIPQFILEDALATLPPECSIICTQPRRISAVSIATRVSEEMGDLRGVGADSSLVGYAVRLETRIGREGRLVFCTTGVLLRRLESDRDLTGVTHVVVDEVHERSLDSDFLLLLLRGLLERRRDLKIILMSATAEASRFANYFSSISLGGSDVPCVTVPGKTYPVTSYFMEDAIEMTGYKVEAGSEYAVKKDRRIRDGGTVAVAGKGGKMRHVRVQWEEEEDGVFGGGGEEEEGEEGEAEGADEVYDEDSTLDSDTLDAAPTYTPQTHRTIALLDPRKLNLDLVERVVRHVVNDMDHESDGSVLVFLPGLAEIRKLSDMLSVEERRSGNGKGGRGGGMVVLPLHSVLSGSEQGKGNIHPSHLYVFPPTATVFKPAPPNMRKIVLATNIAETGITIPDVVCVIDTVRAREVTYDERRNITRLAEVLVSKANCKQRRGRAGRVRAGVCYHLVEREVFEGLPDHRPPEMLRLPLEELCLHIKATVREEGGATKIADVLARALDPPPVKHVVRAVTLLQQIQALDPTESLTPLGAQLSGLPVDARLGKMLLFACGLRCLDPVLTVAASLSLGKSPFLRPFGREAEADAARVGFRTEESDLLTISTAYTHWRTLHLKRTPLTTIRDFCDRHFLNVQNLLMIEEARAQLLRALLPGGSISLPTNATDFTKTTTQQRGLVFTTVPDIYNENADSVPVVMSAITAGLYPNILLLDPPLPSSIGSAGSSPLLHAPGRVDMVRVHKGSVVSGMRLDSGWFVCHGIKGEQQRDGGAGKVKAVAWDLNRTGGGALLGVGVGDVGVDHLQGTLHPLEPSSKLVVRSPPRTASIIAEFGRRVRGALERRMHGSVAANEKGDDEAIRLFIKLVEDEAKGRSK